METATHAMEMTDYEMLDKCIELLKPLLEACSSEELLTAMASAARGFNQLNSEMSVVDTDDETEIIAMCGKGIILEGVMSILKMHATRTACALGIQIKNAQSLTH